MTGAVMGPSARSRGRNWLEKMTCAISFEQALSANVVTMALKTWQMTQGTHYLNLTGLITYSTLVGLTLLGSYLTLNQSPRTQLIRLQGLIQKLGGRVFLGLMLSSIMLADWLIMPATAQEADEGGGASFGFFFTNIQTKVTAIFSSSPYAAEINSIVLFAFGIIQLLFIFYIAKAVVKALESRGEDEDWKQIIKTPLIVAAGVIGGDFAVGLV